ncbi:Hypothetical protein FKW44_000712 [Caligus rogercresseyi]|uniref:Uncharacterized protein n=1 Tax=Caligus rogercresseyi TaxID=217165 RepID=A0A7T8KHQ7_CALRO|nr:Hypothetical protein FKW44_000313 [Caligus rogercresseyi]QQP56147.1 Hypothetical protein FKW44_000712 [Caligus rogercresseyi]
MLARCYASSLTLLHTLWKGDSEGLTVWGFGVYPEEISQHQLRDPSTIWKSVRDDFIKIL